MQVIFWQFSKRFNSTKRPTSEGVAVNFTYKDTTDLHNPLLQIASDVSMYNYAKIDNLYFFVESIQVMTKNIWLVQLHIDLLATYKENIQATKAQVIFSASSYDLGILDNRIVSMGEYTRESETQSFVGTLANQNVVPSGTFALTALSNTSIWATGATTTYFMTYQQMQVFSRELLDASAWESFKQFFNNPMDGVIECYYIPLDISNFIGLTIDGEIQIGDYTFPTATAKKAESTNMAMKSYTTTINIPWIYDDFRRLAPYTEISLFVPFCGSKNISPEMIYNIDYLLIDYSVDVITGNVQAIVYNQEEVIEEFSGNCKLTLPIGQTQSRVDSIIGATGGAITAIAGFASANVALGATGVLSAISSVVTPANNKTMGSMNGSVLGAILGNETKRWQKFRLSVTSRKTADEPDNIRQTIGNALNKVVSLSTLSGYVQTNDASVSIPTHKNEVIALNNLLNGGIYIE